MFEVIISNVNTGRVERKTFASRDQANTHADRRLARLAGKRSHSNYRVEVHHHEPQKVETVPVSKPSESPWVLLAFRGPCQFMFPLPPAQVAG
jgi:hypothetical protein